MCVSIKMRGQIKKEIKRTGDMTQRRGKGIFRTSTAHSAENNNQSTLEQPN